MHKEANARSTRPPTVALSCLLTQPASPSRSHQRPRRLYADDDVMRAHPSRWRRNVFVIIGARQRLCMGALASSLASGFTV
jgi:hypothetical protein